MRQPPRLQSSGDGVEPYVRVARPGRLQSGDDVVLEHLGLQVGLRVLHAVEPMKDLHVLVADGHREASRQGGGQGRIAVIRALEESPSRARRSSPLRSPTSCLTTSALTSWGFVRTTFTSENPALSNFALYSSAGRAPASHPLQAAGLSLSFSGTGFSSTTSDTQNRPPGARTRAASAKTASLSGERLMTQLESRTSAPPS